MAVNTHTVLIKVKQMGARKVSRQMKGLTVGLTAVGLAAVGMAREIIRASDEMTNLGNKSRVFARDQGEAANRMATVVSVARTMNMEMSGVADVMQRVSMSADQVGLSNEQVTTMVANLAKATKLSGATAQEATGALRQFGQALAANRLSGQELNSVLEQTPMIARIIADSMGVAVGELRALGKEGKITATVMKDALGGTIDDLDEKFAKFKFPIADQFVSLKRESTILVDNLSKLSGAGETLGDAIKGGVDFVTELNRSFATGGPMAQEFMGQLDKLKSIVIALGVAWAGSKLITGMAGLVSAAMSAKSVAGFLGLIPHPLAKIASLLVLAGGATYAYFKATSETEKKALKPLRTELENASMALADISNKNEDAIKFWKDHYNMTGQSTEALKEFAEAQVEANQSVMLLGESVKKGDFATLDDALDAAYARRKSGLEQAMGTIAATTPKTSTGDLLPENRKQFDALKQQLNDLNAAYQELFDKRQGLKDLSAEMENLTKTAITDFRSEYDANWPVQSLMDDLTAIGSTYRDVVNQTGGLTQEQLAEMRRLYQGVGNELIGLIPVSKEFNDVTGDLDTSSFAYENLMKLLEGTGLKLSDLTEFTERFKNAQDDANDALEDANDLLDDKQDLYKKLESNMDPVVALQNEFNRRAREGKELLGEGSAELRKYLDLLDEWKTREQINIFSTGAGKTGDPLAQAAGEAAQFPQQQAEAQSGVDGLVGMGLMTEEQGQNAMDNLQRRHEMNQQLLEDQAAMETMNQGILEGELSAAELREGAFASMREGFASVAGPALDLGANISKITAAGVGGLTNSITEMATTGKANFKELGKSFLTMITQMIVQMTVMMALVTAIGMLPGGGAMLKLMGMGAPGKAAGGPVAGGQPYLVGERGPELFVPPQSGSMKSNRDLAGMQQQPPQVTVVNVASSETTLSAMGSEEGESIIMNVIQRNPEILRSIS